MKKIFLILSVALLAVGCETFLDTKSYTERNTGNYPNSEAEAIQLVTGIYSTLYGDTGNPGEAYFMIAELASDDRFGGGGMDDVPAQSMDHLMYSDLNMHAAYWETCYQGIGRANMAVANLDKVEDADMRNQLMGEALFLRAHYYFTLAQMFGPVPLVDSVPQNVEEASKYPAQATEEEIYGFITASLKQAVEIMPSIPYSQCLTGKGHVTKWDAEALLARVYLFYTGFYSDKWGKSVTTLPLYDLENGTLSKETVDKAYVVKALEDCRDNSGHSLVPDYRLLWAYSNEWTKTDYQYMVDANVEGSWYKDGENPEQMFNISCTYASSSMANRYNQYFGIRKFTNGGSYDDVYPFAQGYGFGPVTWDMWNQWEIDEPGDIRRAASIYNVNDEAPNYKYGNEQQMEETGLWQKKYQAIACHDENGEKYMEFGSLLFNVGYDLGRKYSPVHLTLIRFADVLLMHSELTGDPAGMNLVRGRVGLPAIGYSLEAIQKERRHEFAFEGLRWGDMRRWGKAYATAALAKQVGQNIWNVGEPTVLKDQGDGYVKRYEATWGFRPYPQTEVELSEGILTYSNTGWDSASALYSSWK